MENNVMSSTPADENMKRRRRKWIKVGFSVLLLFLLCILLGYPSFLSAFHLEITDSDMSDGMMSVRGYGAPLMLFIFCMTLMQKGDPLLAIMGKVFVGIAGGVVLLVCLVVTMFSSMCVHVTEDVLYRHVTKQNATIVRRSFGCGAVDSSPSHSSLYYQTALTNWLSRFEYTNDSVFLPEVWNRTVE